MIDLIPFAQIIFHKLIIARYSYIHHLTMIIKRCSEHSLHEGAAGSTEIRKLIIDGCHVTVKGDGTLTIAEGILAPRGTLEINSGHIKIDFTSSANSFSSAISTVTT